MAKIKGSVDASALGVEVLSVSPAKTGAEQVASLDKAVAELKKQTAKTKRMKAATAKLEKVVIEDEETGEEREVVSAAGYRCKKHGKVKPYCCGSYRRCPICTKERVERWKARKAAKQLDIWTAAPWYHTIGKGREAGRAVNKQGLLKQVEAAKVKETYRKAERGELSN